MLLALLLLAACDDMPAPTSAAGSTATPTPTLALAGSTPASEVAPTATPAPAKRPTQDVRFTVQVPDNTPPG